MELEKSSRNVEVKKHEEVQNAVQYAINSFLLGLIT
jgi:hypothetical protein